MYLHVFVFSLKKGGGEGETDVSHYFLLLSLVSIPGVATSAGSNALQKQCDYSNELLFAITQ